MKVKNEMSMMRWVCGFVLKESKKNAELENCWHWSQST